MTDAQLALEMADLVIPEPEPEQTIGERFEAFHAANPWVLQALIALAENARAHGETRVGVKALFERLRWSYNRATTGDVWRLNNSYTSRYARLIAEQRPDLAPMIQTRKLRAA